LYVSYNFYGDYFGANLHPVGHRAFFFTNSTMHCSQNTSLHSLHSIGDLTISKHIMQNSLSRSRFMLGVLIFIIIRDQML